jgi:hypothetical protein
VRSGRVGRLRMLIASVMCGIAKLKFALILIASYAIMSSIDRVLFANREI